MLDSLINVFFRESHVCTVIKDAVMRTVNATYT